MNDEVNDKKSDGIGYVGSRLSKKQVKLMMIHAATPEARKIFAELMPKPQKRYG